MCLGVPGKIVAIDDNAIGMPMGRVSFGGVLKEVCLVYVPEAQVGDYVIVHVGHAIGMVDPEEAERTLALFATLADAETAAGTAADPAANLPTARSA